MATVSLMYALGKGVCQRSVDALTCHALIVNAEHAVIKGAVPLVSGYTSDRIIHLAVGKDMTVDVCL